MQIETQLQVLDFWNSKTHSKRSNYIKSENVERRREEGQERALYESDVGGQQPLPEGTQGVSEVSGPEWIRQGQVRQTVCQLQRLHGLLEEDTERETQARNQPHAAPGGGASRHRQGALWIVDCSSISVVV